MINAKPKAPLVWEIRRSPNGSISAWGEFHPQIIFVKHFRNFEEFAREFRRTDRGWILDGPSTRSTLRLDAGTDSVTICPCT